MTTLRRWLVLSALATPVHALAHGGGSLEFWLGVAVLISSAVSVPICLIMALAGVRTANSLICGAIASSFAALVWMGSFGGEYLLIVLVLFVGVYAAWWALINAIVRSMRSTPGAASGPVPHSEVSADHPSSTDEPANEPK